MALLKVNTVESTLLESCDPNSNDFSGINRIFLSVQGFLFDTVTLFESSSQWETDITAENIYQFDKQAQVIDQSEAAVYRKSNNGQTYPVRPGRMIHEYRFDYSDAFHKVLLGFDQQLFEVFLSDRNNNIYGTTDDGVTVRGFRINVLNVEKRQFGTQQKVFSILKIEYADFIEFDKNSVVSNVEWIKDGLVTN